MVAGLTDCGPAAKAQLLQLAPETGGVATALSPATLEVLTIRIKDAATRRAACAKAGLAGPQPASRGGAFPDGESALNLAAARLRHIAGRHWSTRRILTCRSAARNYHSQDARRLLREVNSFG